MSLFFSILFYVKTLFLFKTKTKIISLRLLKIDTCQQTQLDNHPEMGKYTQRERIIQLVTDLVTVCLSKYQRCLI